MSVGHPVAVNIGFLFFWGGGDISDFLALVFSQLYGYSMPLKAFLVNISVCFIGQCWWYFNSQWTPVQAINKAGCVCIHISQLRKIHSCCVSFKSGFFEGFKRWRPSIVAPQRNPDLQGSCSLASHYSLSDRSEPNLSKLQHTVCNFCVVHSAISRAHCVTFL